MTAPKLVQGYEVVIGFETHAQLSTKSKIFSRASVAFGAEPNTQACAVDMALPGTLPVMNIGAVERAIEFGLGVNAHIAERSIFARKTTSILTCPRATKSASLKFRWCKVVRCRSSWKLAKRPCTKPCAWSVPTLKKTQASRYTKTSLASRALT